MDDRADSESSAPGRLSPAERFRRRTLPLMALLLGGGWVTGLLARPLAQALGGPSLQVALALDPARPSSLSGGPERTPFLVMRGESSALDPWGRPILIRQVLDTRTLTTTESVSYSAGPNGTDDDAGGDDVVPSAFDEVLAAWLGEAVWILGTLGGALGMWQMLLLHMQEASTVRREMGQAVLVALPVSAGLWVVGTRLAQPWDEALREMRWTVIPMAWTTLAFGSSALLAYALTAGIRLRLRGRGILPVAPAAPQLDADE